MMHNEQASLQNNEEHSVALRTQRIVEYLAEQWQGMQGPSADTMRRITEFVVSLPKPYQKLAFKVIADHFVNYTNLHILKIMALFEENAEQEGIGEEERKGTFEDVLPETLQLMMQLNRQVSVQSIDDLTALSNITIGLCKLYQSNSAEDAQRVIYELPSLYYRELVRKNLVGTQESEVNSSTPLMSSNHTNWASSTYNHTGISTTRSSLIRETKGENAPQ